jgi:hypothetical protein
MSLRRGPLPHGHGSVTLCILSRAREQAVSDFFIKLKRQECLFHRKMNDCSYYFF